MAQLDQHISVSDWEKQVGKFNWEITPVPLHMPAGSEWNLHSKLFKFKAQWPTSQ